MPAAAALACCGPGCRAHATSSGAHYDAAYFKWQSGIGVQKAESTDWLRRYGAQANDTVLDFGAGTGAILASLGNRVRGKVAVEFSDTARAYMRDHHRDIELHKYPETVPDNSVSLVVSTSVIEHVECPIQELAELRRKLIPGGRVVIGIKNEGVELWRSWSSDNVDNHLYTWNSMLLGNTLRASGFLVDRILVQAASVADTENMVVARSFGRRSHTFQYLWAEGHVRRPDERWPQAGKAPLRLLNRPQARQANATHHRPASMFPVPMYKPGSSSTQAPRVGGGGGGRP